MFLVGRPTCAAMAVAILAFASAGGAWAQGRGLPPLPLGSMLQQPGGSSTTLVPLDPPDLGGVLPEVPRLDTAPRGGRTRSASPSDAERLRRGLQLLKQRDYAGAIRNLHPIRERYPQARQVVIYAMLQQKRYDDAVFELEQAEPYPGRDQNLLFAYTRLAGSRYEHGSPGLAVKWLSRLKRHNRKEAVRLLYEIGDREAAKSSFADARLAYAAIGEEAKALNGKARAEFALGRYREWLRTMDTYARHDKRDAAVLKGELLLSIGAFPKAVQAFAPYPDHKGVRTVMGRLQAQGLAKYRKSDLGAPDWEAYEAEGPGSGAESRVLLFPVQDGQPQPGPVFELISYRAPRPLSAGRLLATLWTWRWPETDEAREYRLTVNQAGGSHVAAFWPYSPAQDELMKALAWAREAAPKIRLGDQFEHRSEHDEAIEHFAFASGMRYVGHDAIADWPHYAGLERLLGIVSSKTTKLKWDFNRTRAAERIRGLLFDNFPHWGRLAWARALANDERLEEARAVWQDLAETWPDRHESWAERGELEWQAAYATARPDRHQLLHSAQAAWNKVLKLKPDHVAARLRLAQLYLLYGAHAFAAEAVTADKLHTRHAKFQGIYDYLQALKQHDFEMLGTVENETSGMRFTIYRNRMEPPSDPTIIHHAAEIIVRDKQGLLRETFAIASQAFLESEPRDYFLDRVTTTGRDMLARYGRNAPEARAIAEELARQ